MTNQKIQLRTVGVDGGLMAVIPAGEFLMGAVDDDDMGYTKSFREEKPQHIVYLDAFHIDVYQVTNARYEKFVEAADHPAPKSWGDANFSAPNQPVVGVNWFDAWHTPNGQASGSLPKRNGKRLHAAGW